MSPTNPVAPPPSRPKRTRPADPAPDVQAAAEAFAAGDVTYPASTEVAHPVAQADPVEALGHALGGEQTDRQRALLAAVMGIGRPIDPETDLTAGPNRYPKYVVAAVLMIHASTGRSKQSIMSDAVTGKEPIPATVLDAAFRELYGRERR